MGKYRQTWWVETVRCTRVTDGVPVPTSTDDVYGRGKVGPFERLEEAERAATAAMTQPGMRSAIITEAR